MLIFIALLFLWQSFSYGKTPLKIWRPSSDFSDDWQVSVEGGVQETIQLPCTKKQVEPEQLIQIEKKLPNKNLSGYYLRIGSSQQEFRVYLNGEQIYWFPSMRKANHGKTGGATWVLVQLPEDSSGKTVSIQFRSSYKKTAGRLSRVWLGKEEELRADLYLDSVGGMSLSVSLLILSAFLAIMRRKRSKRQGKQHEKSPEMLIICIALWIFCQSQYQVFLFHNYAFCYFLEFSLLYLFPVLLNTCLEQEFGLREKLLKVLSAFHLLLAVVFFVGQLAGWYTLFQVQDFFLCVFAVTFLLDLAIVIKNRKQEERLKTCLVILGIFFVMFLLDFLLYDVYLPIAPFNFIQIGVVLSELYIVYIVIRQWLKSIEVGYQNAYLKMQLEHQLSHYSELEKKNYDLKCFRHDIRNHLRTMQRLIEKQQVHLVSEYIQDMEAGLKKKDRQLIETGNPILDAVLSEKMEIAAEHGIQVQHEIAIFKNIRLENVDGCAIFGNILDNAMEACLKMEDKEKRMIKIKMTSKANMLICKFWNTVDEKTPIDKELRTTKEDVELHGMGIKNIKNSVKKYGGEVTFERKENYFEVSFVLFDV